MALYDAARHSERISFYCPYGHEQIFNKGETDLDVARRERDLARQQLAQRDDEIKQLTMQVDQHRTAATKARKRAAAGVCPCCNRSFASTRMAAHIRTKHPDFKAEEIAA